MFEGLRCVVCLDTLFVPVYVHALSKLVFKLSENDSIPKTIIYIILRLLMTAVLLPIACFALLFCAVLTDVVHCIARINFGSKYVDSASGGDAMYSGDHRLGKGIIPAVYYIEEKGPDSVRLLMEHLKRTTIKVQQNHSRLQCIHEQFFGYVFFLKAQDIGLTFIQYFDDYSNDEEFTNVLNKKIGSALPLNNTFLWDVTLGRKSVHMQGKKCIPLLFRLHHSLGDGVTLMTLLMTNYADQGCDNIRILCDSLKRLGGNTKKEHSQATHENKKNVLDDFLKSLYKLVNWVWNADLYFGFDITKDAEMKYAWHGEPSGDISLLALGLDQSEEVVEKVKKIKNKLKVSFNDVILGVICATFTKFFIQRMKAYPPTIVTLNPYNLNANNFNDLLTFNAHNEPVTNLGNKFTIAMISLPINEENLKEPKRFILDQHKITNHLKHSIDFQYMFWMVHKLVSIMPLPIVVPMQNLYRPSTLVTNLPPLSATRIIDHDIIDMTLSSVHCYDVSTCVTVYSYDNIFHVSTMFDKTCINDDQQKVFNKNIVQFIGQLYEHL